MTRFTINGVAALVCGVVMSTPLLAQRTSPPVPLAAGARAAHGVQAPGAPPPGTGAILGIAEDSLHGGALPAAVVSVVQLPGRSTRTTADGAFRLDSLPPGRYTLELSHPVTDSLGLRVMSDSIDVQAGAVQNVVVSIPSARRIVDAICSPIKRRLGPGAVIGHVDDAVTGAPAVGAEVSVAWVETEISTVSGVQTLPRLREGRVSSDGTFRICGVPSTLNATLQAQRGAAKTAEVPLKTTEEPLVMRVLYLPPPPAPAVATAGAASAASPSVSAVITGKVTNAGGVPVAGARVTVQGTGAGTSTADDGSFTLTGVPPGTQAVLVRRVGYNPVQMPMDVKVKGLNPLTVRLGAYAPRLAEVTVKAKKFDQLASTGFTRRQKMGLGRYLDQKQIDEINPTYTTDVLRRIPGLYVLGEGATAAVTTTRGNGCVNYLLDGNPIRGGQGQTIDELVNPQDVQAVEFYNQATIPLELTSGLNDGCALLVIWTKASLKAPPTGH